MPGALGLQLGRRQWDSPRVEKGRELRGGGFEPWAAGLQGGPPRPPAFLRLRWSWKGAQRAASPAAGLTLDSLDRVLPYSVPVARGRVLRERKEQQLCKGEGSERPVPPAVPQGWRRDGALRPGLRQGRLSAPLDTSQELGSLKAQRRLGAALGEQNCPWGEDSRCWGPHPEALG